MVEAIVAGVVWLYDNPVAVVFLIFLTVALIGYTVRRVASSKP